MTDGNNNTTTFEYDAINRLTKATDQEGKYTTYQYNWHGKVTRVTDALRIE